MKRDWPILSMCVLLLLLFSPDRAAACSCAIRTPCEAFADATAVFIGRVLDGTEKVETSSKGDVVVSIEAGMVRFAVEETFKGALGSETGLAVSSNKGTSCGPYGLIRGERYVVYAYGKPGSLATGVCTRTNLASKATNDLEFLHNLPEIGSGGRLYGGVLFDKNEERPRPASGITLILRDGEGRETKVVTNDKGLFEINNLKPGDYEIEVFWPPNYTSEYSKKRITISDRGCSEVSFWQ